MVGKVVEVHLLSGKRFLGLVVDKDSDGITMRCLPLKVLETSPCGGDIVGQLRSITGTKFFPYINIEYVDIGGEPVGFDALFAQWFRGTPLVEFFGSAAATRED
ncbi:hypothetical protein HS125_03135 [bacterium]|nr:hypothetical protein [bacterium]